MKLMLGTAQFGLDYGISNSEGQTPLSEVERILDACVDGGIRYIDTAVLYGNSEAVLGKTLGDRDFKLVTKTLHLTNCFDVPDIRTTFNDSCLMLGRRPLYGLLFHNADALNCWYGKTIYAQACDLREQGVVEKIGVSVYRAEQIEWVLDNFDIDLIQLPLSVLDQRLLKGGYLRRLKERGVEIHSRSAFLQGLLMLPPTNLDPYFFAIHPLLQRWHDEIHSIGATSISAALGFLKAIDEVDRIVVGVNNAKQLKELVDAYHEDCVLDYSSYGISDPKYLDPSQWRLLKK